MTSPPVATLGGVTLTGTVSWAQTTGPSAPLQTFQIHESEWGKMKPLLGTAVDLVIAPETAHRLVWRNLYPIREAPTNKPYLRSVRVSDIRWRWSREIVVRSYNIPRKTGNRRLVAGVVELAVDYDLYGYTYASLQDAGGTRRKWQARDCIEDVLSELAEKCGHEYEIRGLPVERTDAHSVEGLDLQESGDSAFARVLRMIPRAEVTVTKDGVVVIFDASDTELTEEIAESAGPPTEAGQIDRVISLNHLKPSKIYVYFGKEVELRFDSSEEVEAETISREWNPNDPSMTGLENVLPLPDPYTVINNERKAQGTYVPIRNAIRAWNQDIIDLTRAGRTPPPLTFANIRKYWFVLEAVYTPIGYLSLSGAQANWVTRIATLRQHYRQTYQIPRNWMRRIRQIRPERLGTISEDTASRAPSQCWSQYCAEPNPKAYAIAALQNDPNLQFYWLNVNNYPMKEDDDGNLIPNPDGHLWDKPPSPAIVSVLDQEQGVLHVSWKTDPYGLRSQIHPSMMRDNDSGKLLSLSRDLRSDLRGLVAVDGRVTGAVPIGLAGNFRIAMLVSAMPSEPNNEGRLFRFEVTPEMIQKLVPSHFDVTGGTGPPWHIAVPQSLATAWYGLKNPVHARNEGAPTLFGFNAASIEARNFPPGYEVLNYGETPGPAILDAMARAVAAAQWAAFITQREGTRAVHLKPGIEVEGTIEGVRHYLDASGRLITELGMNAARRPLDPLALVPSSVRPWVVGTIFDQGVV